MEQGWICYIAYGRSYNPSKSKLIKIGNKFNVYEHYLESRLFDNEGLASRYATKQLIKEINRIQPSVIHLHNIHDYWLNYRLLFEYLNKINIPIIWTQHDCWSYTGGCTYYSIRGCNKWIKECFNCPKLKLTVDNSRKHYHIRKCLFTNNSNITFVPVSSWLYNEMKKSFLKDCNIVTILNGVNINTFHPFTSNSVRKKYGIEERFMLMGVATIWSERKGFNDFKELSKYIDSNTVIVLVGLSDEQINSLPNNMIGIPRTSDINELVALYSAADIVLNLSREETFGLTTIEGNACGTPSIVYNTTASPELVTSETGFIVEPGDIEGILNAIDCIKLKGKHTYSKVCRQRVVNIYNIDNCVKNYINLYESLIS